jgi:hypothetical protein
MWPDNETDTDLLGFQAAPTPTNDERIRHSPDRWCGRRSGSRTGGHAIPSARSPKEAFMLEFRCSAPKLTMPHTTA